MATHLTPSAPSRPAWQPRVSLSSLASRALPFRLGGRARLSAARRQRAVRSVRLVAVVAALALVAVPCEIAWRLLRWMDSDRE